MKSTDENDRLDEVSGAVSALYRRVKMFLEDGNFTAADAYCERILDQSPEDARAYVGKLMAERRVRNEKDLADCEKPFSDSDNFQKAIRFADNAYRSVLESYNQSIMNRLKEQENLKAYSDAVDKMKRSSGEAEFLAAADIFRSLGRYSDVESLAAECEEKAKAARLESESRRIADEKRRQHTKKIAFIIGSALTMLIAAILVLTQVIIPSQKYNNAQKLLSERKYDEASSIFYELGKYKDSKELRIRSIYLKATDLIQAQRYDEAITEFERVDILNKWGNVILYSQYHDTDLQIKECKYLKAKVCIETQQYAKAVKILYDLGEYKDSKELLALKGMPDIFEAYFGKSVLFGHYDQDNNTANGKEPIEWLVLYKDNDRVLLLSKRFMAEDTDQSRRILTIDGSYKYIETDGTWENSWFRAWLNNTFLQTAFTEKERDSILFNQAGNVFLLSKDEIYEYLPERSMRVVEDDGLLQHNDQWFLRTYVDIKTPSYVHFSGYIEDTIGEEWEYSFGGFGDSNQDRSWKYDGNVNYYWGCIRPAIWVDLDSGIF